MNLHGYLPTRSARAHLQDGHAGPLWRPIAPPAAGAEHLGEEALRRFELTLREPNRIEAANRHLDGHGTPAPGCTLQPPSIVYQLETLSLRIAERQHQLITCAACLDTIMRNVQLIKALDPPV